MPVDYSNYPANWREVSREVRAVGHCEQCGVQQYAVGYWMDNVFWHCYDGMQSYAAARQAAESDNAGRGEGEPKRIVIVLTAAHLRKCDPLCAIRGAWSRSRWPLACRSAVCGRNGR